MDRRAFLAATLGSGIVATPAQAQRRPSPARIAVLTYADGVGWLAPFAQALGARGFAEGRDFSIEVRAAHGKLERLHALAAETVDSRPDVIVATTTPGVNAAVAATRAIPIVMAPAGDALRTGHVKSLARPGGNVTGLTLSLIALAGKTTALLGEALPRMRKVACIVHRGDPLHVGFAEEAEVTAGRLGLQFVSKFVASGTELDVAFREVARQGADGVVLQPIFLVEGNLDHAVRQQFAQRMPTISGLRRFADAGGLVAYASEFSDVGQRVATYVERILRGARPGDLPVEQPSRFDLVINLRSAQALGVDFAPTLLARADAVLR